MSAAATAIASWVSQTPLIDGVLFGASDGEVDGPPICAVAVAGRLRGYGKGHTQSQALASAVGEVIEQVAASRVDRRRLRRSAFYELAAQAFDPRWLGLYSPKQYACLGFPFKPFDQLSPLYWLPGYWLDTNEHTYLPAFAVYLSDELAPEALCQVTSNGLGAGLSLEAAIEHAVLELYEREAFLSSWMFLSPKRKLEVTDHGGILASLKTRGAETEVYLLSESPVHVAVAVALGDGIRWPAFTLGLGAARNAVDAADKAILELGQTSPYLASLWRHAEVSLPKARQDIKSLQDHALYYCDPAHRSEFEIWLSVGSTAQPASRSHIRPRIAIADITPPELETSPYRVVRALGRGFQTIHAGSGFERIAGRSLKNHAPSPVC